jgi:hypothetical protein
VILSGEVGVFVPRAPNHIVTEIDTVQRMIERLGYDDPNRAEIRKYILECNETDDRKAFLSKIDSISDGKNIQLSQEYLSEKLGGIPWQNLPYENFFNPVAHKLTSEWISELHDQLCIKKWIHVR